MSLAPGQGADLAWGRGGRVLEVFLEPTCPHSTRAFGKLMPLLERVGCDRLTVRLRLQSQPWHLFSAVVCRAVLAAASLPGGRDAARRVLAAVATHRDAFVAEKHCLGPNMQVSPAEILLRIERLTGLALGPAFEDPSVTQALKWHARHARQHQIHESPTFMVDGTVHPGMGSRDEIGKWIADLGLD